MNLPSWPFALLRFGVLGLIYVKIGPHDASLYGQPLLYYGLPFFMILAVLGFHRYTMLPLGTLLIAAYLGDLFPRMIEMNSVPAFTLAMVTFFLGFTPCDRDFSIRALWHSGDSPADLAKFQDFKADPRGMWTLYCGMVCALYLALLIKRTNPNFLQGNLVGRALIQQFLGADFLFASWFPAFCAFLAVLLWSVNLTLCILVWMPRLYKQFLIMALVFNAFFLFVVPGRDMGHLVFLLLLIPFAGVALSFPKTSNVLTTT